VSHVRQSLKFRSCAVDQSVMLHAVVEPSDFSCPRCSVLCADLPALNEHLRAHLVGTMEELPIPLVDDPAASPGLAPEAPAAGSELEQVVLEVPIWKCSVCAAVFDSNRALKAHEARAHRRDDPLPKCVITNQCPLCLSCFSCKKVAVGHVRQSLRFQSCAVDQSLVEHTVILPRECVCPLCKTAFRESG
jgi:hypothetical protein